MYSPTTELKNVKYGSINNYKSEYDTRIHGWCCVDWFNYIVVYERSIENVFNFRHLRHL